GELVQLLEGAKPVANGNHVVIDVNLPEDALGALLAAVKMLPPMSGSSSGAVQPAQLLKKFDPKVDKPITKQTLGRTVTVEDGGWRIQHQNEQEQASLGAEPNYVPLFEIPRPAVKGRRVTLRAQVRTEGKNIPSAACLEIDPGEHAKRTLGPIRQGTNNWALYEVSMDCPPDSDPPSLRINV